MTISPLQLLLRTLLVGLVLWTAFDWALDQRDDAIRERDSAVSERDHLREAARISGEMLAARDLIDQQRTRELNDEQNKNLALRLAVDGGHQRLPVRATCAVPVVPSTTRAGGVADAGTAELAADARPDYFTLRDQLALSKQMILGLQDHIRLVIQRSPAATPHPQTDAPQ